MGKVSLKPFYTPRTGRGVVFLKEARYVHETGRGVVCSNSLDLQGLIP